jgi:D-alanyl-lipoteichoic acid acyltransferase DltB (MBOAT superfamily)
LSGFWHGANWTFVLWGAYHALLFVPLLLMNKNRRYRDTVATITLPDGTIKTKLLPSFKETGQMLLTFSLAVFGWIIFRATGLKTLSAWISGICDFSLFSIPYLVNRYYYIPLFISIFIMILGEWTNRINDKPILSMIKSKGLIICIEISMILLIYLFAPVEVSEFIYFQF